MILEWQFRISSLQMQVNTLFILTFVKFGFRHVEDEWFICSRGVTLLAKKQIQPVNTGA